MSTDDEILDQVMGKTTAGGNSGSSVLPRSNLKPGLKLKQTDDDILDQVMGAANTRNAQEIQTPLNVQRTMDADTLEGGKGGTYDTYRFAGIDAPESSQGNLGPAAHQYLDQELKRSKKVSYGEYTPDAKGRRVTMIYADGRNLNLEMVKRGLVDHYDRYAGDLPAPVAAAFKKARDDAKTAKLGIWAEGSGYENPEIFRQRQTALYGRAAAGMGHEKRERVEQRVQTDDDILDQVLGVSKAPAGAAPGQMRVREPTLEERYPVFGKNKYQKPDGFLDRAINALDYAGNVSRSALTGLTGPAGDMDRALAYGRQAASKDRFTDATELKDTLTSRFAGKDKVRVGKDDGKFQVGDISDFGTDLILDVAVDPMTWASSAASRLLKGSGTLAKGAVESRLALKTPDALKFQVAETVGRGGIGAMYGYAAGPEDGTPAEKLAATAAGAIVGAGSPAAFRKLGSKSGELFDDATNWYATKSRGSKFGDYAVQRMIAIRSFDKMKNIAEWIRQGRLKALEDLSPAERLEATQLMQALKTETLVRRAERKDLIEFADDTPEYEQAFNKMTREINTEIENDVLPRLIQNKQLKVARAITDWADHNERVVKKLNKMVYGVDEATAEGKGIVGLRFHVDDVYAKKDFTAAENELIRTQVHEAKDLRRSDAAEKLGPDKSYGVYAEDFSKSFLNDVEHKAIRLMADYKEAPVASRALRASEYALNKFDKLTNFAKANMLYFSTSWLKNNYFDNLAKSYVENGLGGFVDAASMGAFQKGVSSDVRNLYSGKFDRAYKSEYFMDALNYGALDNPQFKALTNEITRDFIFRPEKILKADDKTIGNYIKKANDLWMDKNPVIALTKTVGSHMEGTARMMTYIRTYEMLKKNKAYRGVEDHVLKQMAADVVKKTFFDYGDVSKFEQAVLKRIIPFYSFYAKNLPYWIEATFDPVRAGRIIHLDKVRTNIGSTPTEYDRSGMTPHVQDNAPRKMGIDAKGNTVYTIVPSSSHHEALEMLNPLDWPRAALEKANTIPKGLAELASGRDFFSGDTLYPSDQKGGKKFLYSRGFKWYAIKKAAEASGLDSDSLFQKAAGVAGVDVDANGNPYTTEGWTVVLDKLGSTFLPHGFVDTVAGSVGKDAYDKDGIDEILGNVLLPVTKVKVSESFARMVRERKRKEKEDGK